MNDVNFLQRSMKRQRMFPDDVDVPIAQEEIRAKLKSRFEGVFAKYERDFTGIGDEIDFNAGQVVVDNGHLRGMNGESDAGTTSRVRPASESDSDAEWENISGPTDGDLSVIDPRLRSPAGHDALVRQLGENIAAEIATILSDHGLYHASSAHQKQTGNRPKGPRALASGHSSSVSRRYRSPSSEPAALAARPSYATEPSELLHPRSPPPDGRHLSIWDPRPSPQQLSRSINPGLGSDSDSRTLVRWTKDDIRLLFRLKRTNMSSAQIAKYLPGRSTSAVRQKYRLYCLAREDRKARGLFHDPAAPAGEKKEKSPKHRWTREELVKMIDLHERQGLDWDQIATHFPRRSRKGMMLKYSRLRDGAVESNPSWNRPAVDFVSSSERDLLSGIYEAAAGPEMQTDMQSEAPPAALPDSQPIHPPRLKHHTTRKGSSPIAPSLVAAKESVTGSSSRPSPAREDQTAPATRAPQKGDERVILGPSPLRKVAVDAHSTRTQTSSPRRDPPTYSARKIAAARTIPSIGEDESEDELA